MSQTAFTIGKRVYVLDSNQVIELKSLDLADQWPATQLLQRCVEAGHIAFPRQVVTELRNVQYPDHPGAWLVGGAAPVMPYPEPGEATLVTVQAVVGQMFPTDTESEPADPYVVALAYELAGQGYEVLVVSEDYRDTGGLVSVRSACEQLTLGCASLRDLLDWAEAQDI